MAQPGTGLGLLPGVVVAEGPGVKIHQDAVLVASGDRPGPNHTAVAHDGKQGNFSLGRISNPAPDRHVVIGVVQAAPDHLLGLRVEAVGIVFVAAGVSRKGVVGKISAEGIDAGQRWSSREG